jgi:hypothetical protein
MSGLSIPLSVRIRSRLMRIARLVRPVGLVALLTVALACSEDDEPAPGTFAGRLSGARSESLSGSAVAGTVFTEAGVSYTLNLLDEGDESVFLTIFCPGEEPPGAGTHPLGAQGDCTASYRRTVNDPFTTTEQADAESGSLVVRGFGSGAIAGSLEFTGPLLADGVQEGDLTASAKFDAEPIAAGGR